MEREKGSQRWIQGPEYISQRVKYYFSKSLSHTCINVFMCALVGFVELILPRASEKSYKKWSISVILKLKSLTYLIQNFCHIQTIPASLIAYYYSLNEVTF